MIEFEERKVYYKCNKTNSDGDKCIECKEDWFDISKEGLCVDNEHCEKKDEDSGMCIKCNEDDGFSLNFCLNKHYGCVETYLNKNCLRCDANYQKKCISSFSYTQSPTHVALI